MAKIQEWIYQLEEASGPRYMRLALFFLALITLTVAYNFREFQNFSSPGAMDAAQVGRNLANGEGFTTDFVRPFSMHLIKQHRSDGRSLIEENHPDLANPPMYPLVLAGLMSTVPFDFELETSEEFTSTWRYKPDFAIAWFNQALLFLACGLVFFLGKRLFDDGVAWTAALLFLGSDLLWRFSVSGHSTMLQIVLFLAIVCCLVTLDRAAQANKAVSDPGSQPSPGQNVPQRSGPWFVAMSVIVGFLVGLGGLTCYPFAWLIIPVGGLIAAAMPGSKRWLGVVSLLVCLLVMAPWLARNFGISGTPFGTATFSILKDTTPFPGATLERSLAPDLSQVSIQDIGGKFVRNFSELIRNDIPALGGSLIAGFFFVSLLIPFQNPVLRRLRLFAIGTIVLLAVVQALIRSHRSDLAPVVSSENLLVLALPFLFLFGTALFFILLDQIEFSYTGFRGLLIGLFVIVMCSPLILRFLPPKSHELVYPPYNPYTIQRVSQYMDKDELIMSDMPWAVAWYGNRQGVWLTLNPGDAFSEIHDFRKTISGLYVTPVTFNAPLYSGLLKGEPEWANILLNVLNQRQVPKGFPLTAAPSGMLPKGQLFLSDRARW